jgi:hypothetical protein
MQANLNAHMNGSKQGYQKYLDTIGNDSDKVIEVLDCMMQQIQEGEL